MIKFTFLKSSLSFVNLTIASIVSGWIDRIDDKVNIRNEFTRELYLPHKFKLLLRGSRDGFTPKKFHELCNNVSCTVTFIKVKGTEEILGGYNPLMWKSSGGWTQSKNSFIFSFKNNNNFKDQILSHVDNIQQAIYFHPRRGPSFTTDLFISSRINSRNYHTCYCKLTNYKKEIRDTSANFSIEDYEVFQILKNEI